MILPRGISGFRYHLDPELPSVDYAALKGACYEAARRFGADVELHKRPGYECNFFSIGIKTQTDRVWLLCNRLFPYVSLSRPIEEGSQCIEFSDSGILDEFRDDGSPWIALASDDANVPLTPDSTAELANAEVEQIDYWRPKTVGEIIYNFWD